MGCENQGIENALLPLLYSDWYWQNSDPIQTKKILKFRPNSDWFWPFSTEIQTCWDSPTGCVYDYVNFIDVAKIVQSNNLGSFKKQMNLKVRYRWHCCECNVPMRQNQASHYWYQTQNAENRTKFRLIFG